MRLLPPLLPTYTDQIGKLRGKKDSSQIAIQSLLQDTESWENALGFLNATLWTYYCPSVPIKGHGNSEVHDCKLLSTAGFTDWVKDGLIWTSDKAHWLGLQCVVHVQKVNPWSNPYPNGCCLSQVLSSKAASQWSAWVKTAFLHLGSWQTNIPPYQKLLYNHTSKCFTLNISPRILVLNVVLRIIILLISYSKHT